MDTPRKQKRLEALLLKVRSAAEEEPIPSVEVLEQALDAVDTLESLRPDDTTIGAYSRTITRRLSRVRAMESKLQQARDDARRGWLDEAVREAEAAAKIDPANGEVRQYADKLKQERDQILAILERARSLIDESEFRAARKELLIARDLNGAYPPVQQMNCLLADKRREHDEEVSTRLDEICAANDRREFDTALRLAAVLRTSLKPYGQAAEQLKQQEQRARAPETEREKKRRAFKKGRERLQACDYRGAIEAFDEGLAHTPGLWDGHEQEYAEAVRHHGEALHKQQRTEELLLTLRYAAEEEPVPSVEILEQALELVNEAAALRTDDTAIAAYADSITLRLSRAREVDTPRVEPVTLTVVPPDEAQDDGSIADSFKPAPPVEAEDTTCEEQQYPTEPVPATTEELSPTAEEQAEPAQGVEPGEPELLPTPPVATEDTVQMAEEPQAAEDRVSGEEQSDQCQDEGGNAGAVTHAAALVVALDHHEEGLQPCDPAVPTPDTAMSSTDTSTPMTDASMPTPDTAMSSTPIAVPVMDTAIIEDEAGHAVEPEAEHRTTVEDDLRNAEELEHRGRIIEALAVYQKTCASSPVSLSPDVSLQVQAKIDALTNRIRNVKNLRARGEIKERQGQIADAIGSYRQSLELVPDTSLEEHVAALEERLAKTADEDMKGRLSGNDAHPVQPDYPIAAPEKSQASGSDASAPATEEYGLDIKATLVTRGRRDETARFRRETFARKVRR